MKPNQPGMPETHEEPLSYEGLSALKKRIDGARLLGVSEKGGMQIHAKDAGTGLDESWQRFLAGELWGLQIRYVLGEDEWWDTLMRDDEGPVRLFRMLRDW